MANETGPRFETASTVQSNSIRAKDLAITDDTGWSLLTDLLSILNIVLESTDRSAQLPRPRKKSLWVSPESHGLIRRLTDSYGESKGCARVGS